MMKDIDYTNDCSVIADRVMFHAREEVRLFCEIMECDYEYSYNVADDPHGPVSVGDYFFNMSDIHTVIKLYPRLREKYKTNDSIGDIIHDWYNYSLDMYENHKDEPCINLLSWLYGARPGMLKKEESHE